MAALPIWIQFMKSILPKDGKYVERIPPGMTFLNIDLNTGNPTAEQNLHTLSIPFRLGRQPKLEAKKQNPLKHPNYSELF